MREQDHVGAVGILGENEVLVELRLEPLNLTIKGAILVLHGIEEQLGFS